MLVGVGMVAHVLHQRREVYFAGRMPLVGLRHEPRAPANDTRNPHGKPGGGLSEGQILALFHSEDMTAERNRVSHNPL